MTQDTEELEQASSGQEEAVDASNSQDDAQATEETPRAAKEATSEGQATEAQKMDWEKSYKHLEKRYTQDSQRLKQYERDYNERWKTQLEMYERLEKALANKPEAIEYLQKVIHGQNVDPQLQDNPVYQQLKPQIDKIQQLESFIQEFQQERVRQNAESIVDKVESDAKSFYKEQFGKEPTSEQMSQMINWMVENQFYNGKAAAKELFFDDIVAHRSQSALQANQVKKGLGTTRTQTMNSAAAKKPSSDRMSFKEAWKAAKEEIGWES
jgi:hypothetical protein